MINAIEVTCGFCEKKSNIPFRALTRENPLDLSFDSNNVTYFYKCPYCGLPGSLLESKLPEEVKKIIKKTEIKALPLSKLSVECLKEGKWYNW